LNNNSIPTAPTSLLSWLVETIREQPPLLGTGVGRRMLYLWDL